MTEPDLPTAPDPNRGPAAGTQHEPAHDRTGTDWATRIILGIVMAAALAVGTWSVFTLLTTLLHAPWYVAGFGCFMFDGAAFFFARLSQRYATTTDSGLAPRAAMFAMICTSSWVNWRHAHMENWGTVGGVILAAAPVVAELAFEMWHRFEHREALRRLGRVAQSLPVLGYRSWAAHPFRSRKVIDDHIVAAIIEHQAIAKRRVEIADARARNMIALPPGSVETVSIAIETSRSQSHARTETSETEASPQAPETPETETIPARETAETETGLTTETTIREASHRVSGDRETETSDSVYKPETETALSETNAQVSGDREPETETGERIETAETTTRSRSAETTRDTHGETVSETGAPRVSRPRAPKAETTTVSPIGDRNPETETNHLLGLMRDRGSATAVGLTEAITETGRPKATAAKRLKAARDLYRRETAA